MNLDLIKGKLEDIQTKSVRKEKKEKVDYSKIYFKPTPGKHQIRIVPSKRDKTNPFQEIYLNYGLAPYPIYSLNNWGEKDPIMELVKELRSSKDREDWQIASKIQPKMRVLVPVIVRGKEEEGVRLWEFGKEIYTELLGLAADDDYGDFTDIKDGRDFTLDVISDQMNGKTVNKVSSVRPKLKTSPLSTDKNQIKTWLEEQPNVLDIQTKHSYDEIVNILEKFLNPDITKQSNEDHEIDVVKTETKPVTSKSDDFDSLFENN